MNPRRRVIARICITIGVLVLAAYITAAAAGRISAGAAFLGAGWPLAAVMSGLAYLRGRR